MLDQGRDDRPRRLDVGQRIGDDERLQAGQRLERHRRDLILAQFLDVDTAMVGDGDGGRPESRRIGDSEIDLVICRHGGLEGDALRLGGDVAVGVLDEIEPLALGQGGLQVAGLADQAGLALLADGTFEDRLDEQHAVAIEHRLDLGLGGVGPQHVGDREVHEAQELGAVEQAAQLHGIASLLVEQNAGLARHGGSHEVRRHQVARRPRACPRAAVVRVCSGTAAANAGACPAARRPGSCCGRTARRPASHAPSRCGAGPRASAAPAGVVGRGRAASRSARPGPPAWARSRRPRHAAPERRWRSCRRR